MGILGRNGFWATGFDGNPARDLHNVCEDRCPQTDVFVTNTTGQIVFIAPTAHAFNDVAKTLGDTVGRG